MPRKRIKVVERRLGRERCYGQAYADGLVEIDPHQPPREYLDTLVHETLHIALPDLTETTIADTARTVAGALWRHNYRRVNQ